MSGPLRKRQEKAAWFFLAPALVLIGVFFVLPIVAGLLLSLTDFDIYAIGAPRTARFVGLGNYLHLLRSAEFWQALRNTLYFVLAGGPLTVAVSLGAALLLNTKVRGLPLWRTW